jgi:5-dehydro-2-deoxygluconokinase
MGLEEADIDPDFVREARAVAFPGVIPESLDEGEAGPGFPIEVFNVPGAGDGFMSGLLKGWLDGEDWPTALKYANACGAI